ncbi:hypothetical protein EPA93_18160 [Ktedonosporobacter rubrisoli]|uniref:Uncharacterized protein n=1 Tax=Ktedonosporobacter rubrisoli TaxID=2509675 RepID=A0A4P6JR98_KTERU|nr:hypothetical protein [Ktedonosporobacter rubrisoli]QBD77813.1 hypothetical protein EPA93_18160 [Ktedonosporobacter rubrisoli]
MRKRSTYGLVLLLIALFLAGIGALLVYVHPDPLGCMVSRVISEDRHYSEPDDYLYIVQLQGMYTPLGHFCGYLRASLQVEAPANYTTAVDEVSLYDAASDKTDVFTRSYPPSDHSQTIAVTTPWSIAQCGRVVEATATYYQDILASGSSVMTPFACG